MAKDKDSLLIVDEEAELMRALRETLGEQGFETAGFTSPAGLWRRFEKYSLS